MCTGETGVPQMSPGQMFQQTPVQHCQVSVAQVFSHFAATARTPTAPIVLGDIALYLGGTDGLAGGFHLQDRSQLGP